MCDAVQSFIPILHHTAGKGTAMSGTFLSKRQTTGLQHLFHRIKSSAQLLLKSPILDVRDQHTHGNAIQC